MPDISQLVGGVESGDAPGSLLYGLVSSAPAALSDPLTVLVPSFAGDYSFEVPAGQWMPRGELLPELNVQCLLVIDENGDAWMPAWKPRSMT